MRLLQGKAKEVALFPWRCPGADLFDPFGVGQSRESPVGMGSTKLGTKMSDKVPNLFRRKLQRVRTPAVR